MRQMNGRSLGVTTPGSSKLVYIYTHTFLACDLILPMLYTINQTSMSVGTAKLTSAMESALISLEVSIASATINRIYFLPLSQNARKEGGSQKRRGMPSFR